MKTIVSPIEVALRIVREGSRPETVTQGLQILRICGQTGDLAQRVVSSLTLKGDNPDSIVLKDKCVRFGDLINNFCEEVERHGDTRILLTQFPDWAVTLDSNAVGADFTPPPAKKNTERPPATVIKLRSMAVDILNKMRGLMMLMEIIVEDAKAIGPEELAMPKAEIAQFAAAAKSNRHYKLQLLTFVAHVHAFYNYITVMHRAYLSREPLSPEQFQPLKKQHRAKLAEFKEAAQLAMHDFPEELTVKTEGV